MKKSRSSRHAVPTVNSSEDYLTGLAPSDGDADQLKQQPACPCPGWWVKRSARQVLDKAGQPTGYRHYLMQGKKSTSYGVGADCARTFRKQAEFLNARDERALHRSETDSEAPLESQPQAPHD